MITGKRLAALLDRAFAGRPHGGHGEHVDLGAGEIGARHGAVGEPAHDRLQPVVALVMQMVGLGRGDQDAVDAAREQVGEEAAAAGPEAAEDLGHRALEIGHRAGAGIERLHGVDQHDLAVEPGDVLAEERLYDMRLVGLVAALHHRLQRSRTGRGRARG